MKQKYFFLFVLLGFLQPSAIAQMIQGGAAGAICNALGGPHYCLARTDKTFIPVPAVLPNVGNSTGEGTCISQPGYANEVCRVTDINSETASAGNAGRQQFGPCCGGAANYPEWSADSRLFWIENGAGGTLLYQLDDSVDPPILSCVGAGNAWVTPATNCITVNTWVGGGAAPAAGFEWSVTNPLVFFGSENNSQMWKFTMNGSTAAQPAATMLFDLATAPNCAPSTGAALGPWRVSWNDQDFGGIYSKFSQDSQFQDFFYDLTLGCRWINTLTWQIGGNWGPTGTAVQPVFGPVATSALTSGVATVTLSISATGLPLRLNSPTTFTITNATNASPIVLTVSATCNCDNDVIGVSGVAGNTAANGTWLASASGTSVTLLHLDGSNSTGNAAYTSGGTLYRENLVSASGLTHCAACNGGPYAVTSVSASTVSYVVGAPGAPADVASGADSGSLVDSLQLHEGSISGDGNSLMIEASGHSPGLQPLWQTHGLTVTFQPGFYNGNANSIISNGHHAFEFSHLVNNSDATADNGFCQHGFSLTDTPALATQTEFLPTAAPCLWSVTQADDHLSVSTLVQADNFPVLELSISQTGTPNPTQAGLQEVLAESYSNLGKVSRFCASYQDTSSSTSGQEFATYDGVGVVSPNGKWFVFSSDWGSTLGADASGKIRADAFVCRLK